MAEYIDKRKLMDDLNHFAPECKAALLIAEKQPIAEVEPVRPELRKALKLLEKNYERGLNSDYVRNPVAWALYQTWKEMDGGQAPQRERMYEVSEKACCDRCCSVDWRQRRSNQGVRW